jgi:hypothetical protein
VLTLLCVLACANAKRGASSDPCADFEVEVERVWSAAIKAQVMDEGGAIEVERRSAVTNKMDHVSEDWVRMRTSVCKDHFVRGLISKDDYAARVRCFDDRLDRQRKLVELLQGGGAAEEVEAAIDRLVAEPASCEAASTTPETTTP